MFEYYNNSLCVQGNWLLEAGLINSEGTYRSLTQRGKLKVLRRGGGLGTPALIEFETIRKDIKEKIISLIGDPTEKTKNIIFKDYLKADSKAIEFFNNYTLENGDALPQKNISEYIANAEILNAVDIILDTTMNKRRALGSKAKPWEKIAQVITELPLHQWPHSLPTNHRRLKDKLTAYKNEGYQSLVHKGFCHKNSEKLGDDAKPWVLARWCDRVQRCATHLQLLREYNEMALQNDWKQLKSEQTLINFLQDPKIEPLWYGFRFGELKSKEKYSLQFSTKLPSMRDSLWYSDGTKLNYYYLDAAGKMATCQVYEVFDAYSEVFLGYHISKTEDYEAQYQAYKMAIQISGHKPYEIKFDNQGGHKKLEANSFLGKISRLCTNTAPYNGKSKTIENAFYRFQAGYLKQDWFFTGQNIQAKKNESKADMEMILRNKSELPTLSKLKEIYAKRRMEWNEAPHPKTGMSRIETYLNSHNPETPAIQIWDMVNMFWIQREKPVTCTAYGISFTEKTQKYTYLVYDENRNPDVMWLRENIDRKFIVKFDPDDMTLIHLYLETPLGLRHVAAAETKIEVHRGTQEQEDWENSFMKNVENENKRIRIQERDKMESILVDHGRSAEDYGLRNPLIHGVESSRKQQGKNKTEKTDIGHFQKEASNTVLADNTERDIYSLM
ncbi:kinase [Flavobacterium cerinum]|uniref:Kinase n=1 Tax=Flavobacterium cerinum TaxID=2502784 RepID=A0A444HC36_9FLAO|nr:kinase [Flavobacterium cerinum]RWX00953.1 kinase [Flavobacterium cerinum]